MPSSTFRPSLDEYYLRMLELVAARSTCARRSVGAIITDSRGRVLATGYNGVPSGFGHCTDVPCGGAMDEPGNTARCLAIHAEQNAILQLRGSFEDAHTIYTSCFPCFTCAKLIANTTIVKVVYQEEYADGLGREVLRLKGTQLVRLTTR